MSAKPEGPDMESAAKAPIGESRDQTNRPESLDMGSEAASVPETTPTPDYAPTKTAPYASEGPSGETLSPVSPDPSAETPLPPPPEPDRGDTPSSFLEKLRANREELRDLWRRVAARWRSAIGPVPRVPALAWVLLCALAAGFGAQWLLGGAETVLDDKISRPKVARETVTSLVWLADSQLMIGTASGGLYAHFISVDEALAAPVNEHAIIDIKGRPGRPFTFFNVSLDADLARDFDPEAPAPPLLRRVLLASPGTTLEAEDGLFAIGGGSPTPLIVGQRTLLGNQQQQQQQVASQTPVTGLFRYDIGADGRPQEVGQVGDMSDVRVLVAAPDGTFAVAGTGDGQVVAIDLAPTGLKQPAGLTALRVGTASGPVVTPAPVVAVAAGGSRSDPVMAAAGADGRVSIYKVATVKPPESGSIIDLAGYTYRASEAGLPATNWRIQAMAGDYTPVSISDDGSRIVASRAINEATEYYLLIVGEDGAIGEPTKLQQPFPESEGLIGLPGMADAVFLGGPIADAMRKAEPQLASMAAGSLGSEIAAVSVDRNRDAALISMSDGSLALVTAAEPRARLIGQISRGLVASAISPGGRLLAVIESDGGLGMYDLTGATIASLGRAPQPPKSTRRLPELFFSSDGRRIIVANGDGTIDLYSARDLHLIRREVTDAIFSGLTGSSGDVVARKITEQSFEMITTAKGLPAVRVNLGRDIDAVLVSADGKTAAFALTGGSMEVMRKSDNAVPPQSDRTFLMATAPIGPPDRDGLKFSADGSNLMMRSRDGRLYIAKMDAPESASISVSSLSSTETFFRFNEIPLDAPAVTADIATDGSFLVVGDADNSLLLVDLTDATPQSFDLPEHGAVVNHVAISPDGTKVAAASPDGRVRIVDLARQRFVAGLPLARLASHGDTPKMIARRLDDAPGTFPDTAYLGQQSDARDGLPAVIVFGSYSSLAAAQASVDASLPAYRALTGNGAAAVYLREGVYRAVFETSLGQADAFLQQVRTLAPETADAYVRLLAPWCPDGQARDGYKECGRPPPPAAPAGDDIRKG